MYEYGCPKDLWLSENSYKFLLVREDDQKPTGQKLWKPTKLNKFNAKSYKKIKNKKFNIDFKMFGFLKIILFITKSEYFKTI